MDVAGIGGANIDLHGRARGPIVLRDSNPGTLHFSFGGVTRNILENLSLLGVQTSLISVVGSDLYGTVLREASGAMGMDTTHLVTRKGFSSSSYISLLDAEGDMLIGMSDMGILKTMGAEFVAEHLSAVNCAKLCVCDANLSYAAMEYLLAHATVPTFCDPVSTSWAKEMAPLACLFHTLKPNRMEAEVLTGMAITNKALLCDAADLLLGRGLAEIYITLGADGIYYKNQNGTHYLCKSRPLPIVVNATGAGDAAMAGILYATLHGYSYQDRVHFATASSILALQSDNTISEKMSVENVQRCIKEFIL